MAKRRANGEGSLFRRRDGRWCARLTVNGRRIEKTVGTQKDAKEWLLQMRRQLADGVSIDANKMAFAKYLSYWLEAVKPSLRPKSWIEYDRNCRLHIVPYIGRKKLKDIRPEHIQALYTRLRQEGTGARTIQKTHTALHRALQQAVEWQMIPRNPATAVSRPAAPPKEMQVLNEAQVRHLLVTVNGERIQPLIMMAIQTGMREGELLGLQWHDLDWDSQSVQVRRQIQRIEGVGAVFTDLKTKSSRRIIVLGAGMIAVLHDHRKRIDQERDASPKWQEHNLVFPTSVGTPMAPGNLTRKFKEILQEAGLPSIRFHDLRHTAATLMLLKGVHPKVVQERLGHSSIVMTLDLYSHATPSLQKEAANLIDAIFTSAI